MPRHTQPSWPAADLERLRRYAERGFSMYEAAVLMGRARQTISNVASKYGISFHARGGAPPGNRHRHKGELEKKLAAIFARENTHAR